MQYFTEIEKHIIAKNLKILRIIHEKRPNEIAKILSMDESVIRRIESKNYNLTHELVEKIASIFKISSTEFIDNSLVDKLSIPKNKEYEVELTMIKNDMNGLINGTLVYPKQRLKTANKDIIKIFTLFDLLIYLPLISPIRLADVLFRIYGNIGFHEDYVFHEMNYLYETIPDSKAKKYAEYLTMFNTQEHLSNEMFRDFYEDDNTINYSNYPFFLDFFIDKKDFKICQKDYFNAIEKFYENQIDKLN